MDLTKIVKENPKARQKIIEMNLADIVNKYGVSLRDARELQNYAFLLASVE
jgi:hypothetical protein